MELIRRLRVSLTDIRPVEDRRLLGISLLLVAVVCFTGIDSSAKWLINSGVATGQAVFLRYLVHLVLIVVFLLPVLGGELIRTKQLGKELLRGLMLLVSTALNFLAISYLPLTVTAAIFFVLPLILCALSVPLLKEHVGWRRWVAVIVGFIGVLIIVRPGAETFHWATLLSLGATVAFAFYSILTRKLAGIDSVYTQQFYAISIATICVAPFAIGPMAVDQWVWPSDLWAWVALFAMGLFGAAGHLALTEAHRFAGASTLAPFIYAQIIWMSLSSWLLFNQPPDIWIWVGTPIVILSGLYIWGREKKLAQGAKR